MKPLDSRRVHDVRPESAHFIQILSGHLAQSRTEKSAFLRDEGFVISQLHLLG